MVWNLNRRKWAFFKLVQRFTFMAKTFVFWWIILSIDWIFCGGCHRNVGLKEVKWFQWDVLTSRLNDLSNVFLSSDQLWCHWLLNPLDPLLGRHSFDVCMSICRHPWPYHINYQLCSDDPSLGILKTLCFWGTYLLGFSGRFLREELWVW